MFILEHICWFYSIYVVLGTGGTNDGDASAAATGGTKTAATPIPHGRTMKSARLVLQSLGFAEVFIDFWIDNFPDLSDCPVIRPEDLGFWAKLNKKDKRRGHRLFPGK